MNNKLNAEGFIESCTEWMRYYALDAKHKGFVIGVSGGIDSAVVSTLCAKTGLSVLCLEMPIHQTQAEITRAQEHIEWLTKNHPNVDSRRIDLTSTFDELSRVFQGSFFTHLAAQGYSPSSLKDSYELGLVNSRSRLRMITLYQCATTLRYLVAGTGNKVEDFGIGFYTKYGDGGVDFSPIADIMKTEVYEVAKVLNIVPSIIAAKPTDGLWTDGRGDEDQIGASYPELEWAMEWLLQNGDNESAWDVLTERQKDVISIYNHRNKANQHKMNPIPVFDSSANRTNS